MAVEGNVRAPQAVLSWKSSAFPAQSVNPSAAGPGDREVEMPTGNSPHPSAGYRPRSTGYQRRGIGEARGPRRPGQKEAGQRRPRSSGGDSTTHSPPFGGERPWGSAHTSRFWATGAACLQGAKCPIGSAALG